MGSGNKSITVGYWYGLGLHFGICYGPVDAVTELQVDDRPAWTGSSTGGDIAISRRDLFGGEKREGGLDGTLTILGGEPTQGRNAYLQSVISPDIPAFRGILTAVWRGIVSANNPYIKPWVFRVRRILQGWHGGSAWYSSRAVIGNDMNPAHIIYQTHTDPNWGMGYPVTSINDANFRAVADTLYNEGFGLSILWNRQSTIQQFQTDVLNHIGGILRSNPRTGLFELKLLRDDYDAATLPQFGPDNCTLESYERTATGEMTNEVTVIYTDPNTGKDVPITVQNLAAVQSQGGVVNSSVAYPGITSSGIAARVADRDLRAQSTPLAKVRLRCNREAWDLLPGDCIRLNWPELGINNVVYRILNMNLGTLTKGAIIIDATEDIFGLPSSSYVEQEPVGWAQTGSDPVASPARYVAEALYYDLARELAEADLATITPTDCYISVTSRQPSSDAYEPIMWTRTSGGTWQQYGGAQHCPAGILDGAHARGATTLTLRGSVRLDLVETGGYLVVGGECMRIDGISPAAQTVTVSPGVLDTVPVAHADGEVVFFVDGFQTSDGIQYATGETVEVRTQTQTTRGVLALASTPADSYTMASRQARPYPPGRVRYAGLQYPSSVALGAMLTVSWAHRDRVQQTAGIIDQEAASIGPEEFGSGISRQRTMYSASIHNASTGASMLVHPDTHNTSVSIPRYEIARAAGLISYPASGFDSTSALGVSSLFTSGATVVRNRLHDNLGVTRSEVDFLRGPNVSGARYFEVECHVGSLYLCLGYTTDPEFPLPTDRTPWDYPFDLVKAITFGLSQGEKLRVCVDTEEARVWFARGPGTPEFTEENTPGETGGYVLANVATGEPGAMTQAELNVLQNYDPGNQLTILVGLVSLGSCATLNTGRVPTSSAPPAGFSWLSGGSAPSTSYSIPGSIQVRVGSRINRGGTQYTSWQSHSHTMALT